MAEKELKIRIKNPIKIGIAPCTGECCPGGLIARLATRKVIDELDSIKIDAMCLGFYLVSGGKSRYYYPVVTIDGCSKCCSRRSTEINTDKLACSLEVADILSEDMTEGGPMSIGDITNEHVKAVEKVAKILRKKVLDVLEEQ